MTAWSLWRCDDADADAGGLWDEPGWNAQGCGRPIPDAHAEPLLELIGALGRGQAAFIVSSEGNAFAGSGLAAPELDADRLHQGLACLPAFAGAYRVWPLLPGVWVVVVALDGMADDPMNVVHVHAMRQALTIYLNPIPDFALTGTELKAAGENVAFAPCVRPAITVLPLAQLGQAQNVQTHVDELNALLESLVQKQLHSQFQPIVSLRDGQVIGYEALIRGAKNGLVRRSGAMFRTADKANLVAWYDLACAEQCFATAARQGLKHLLFVNMDAAGLAFCDQQERSLAAIAREHGIAPGRVVVEVTERQTVGDYPRLLRYLASLREEGFKIAIDDAGAGYSSLNTIAEVRPDFVKMDKTLTRNLHRCGEHRALVSALLSYTRHVGAALLAEGAESEEELAALVDLGVPFAQGYVMGKPSDSFRGIHKETRRLIATRAKCRDERTRGRTPTMGDLALPGLTLPPDAPLSQAAQAFARNEALTCVVIVEAGCARGLVLRAQFESVLAIAKAARVGDFLPEAAVEQWMATNVLSTPVHLTVTEAARQATARTDISLDGDVIVTDAENRYVGTLPIRVLLETAFAPATPDTRNGVRQP